MSPGQERLVKDQWTDEQWQKWFEDIRCAFHDMPKYKPPAEAHLEQRRQFLLNQAEQLKASGVAPVTAPNTETPPPKDTQARTAIQHAEATNG